VLDVVVCPIMASDSYVIHDLASSLTNPVKEFDRRSMLVLGIVVPWIAVVCVSGFVVAICSLFLNDRNELSDASSPQNRFIKNALYLSSAAMGMAVFSTYLQYSWSKVIVENPESIDSGARVTSVASGVAFSILIFLMFLPLWFQDKQLSDHSTEEEEDAPKPKHKRSEIFKDVVAALIPAIVSFALQLLGFKTG
jgi:phosphate/sulfate permease